jgi:transcriptional regulator with XRE-family HTH domain
MGKTFTFVAMELPSRIATIIKVNQHTAASFADTIGIQRSSISHILNGRNKPSLDVLEKILTHFPRVDATWLITGKAPAKAPDGPSELQNTLADDLEKTPPLPKMAANSKKDIVRIVVFYADRTFDTYESQ